MIAKNQINHLKQKLQNQSQNQSILIQRKGNLQKRILILSNPVKVHAEGKTDPFDLADGDDEDGGNGKTETSTRNQSKSKKRGGGGGGGKLPNKDGYDDLNPNKKEDEEAKSKMKTEETKSKLQQKDDGYEAIDPTKAVINIENVNESNGKTPSPANKQPNKPRQIPRDAKQQKIAKGAKKGKGDYPTFDDVISDWDSKKEEPGAGGAGGGGAGTGGAVGDKSKVKASGNGTGKKSTITEDGSEKEEKFQLKSRAKTERTQPGNNT